VRKTFYLLATIPVALVLRLLDVTPLLVFGVAALSLVPAAWLMMRVP
jgi:hypothetical protein